MSRSVYRVSSNTVHFHAWTRKTVHLQKWPADTDVVRTRVSVSTKSCFFRLCWSRSHVGSWVLCQSCPTVGSSTVPPSSPSSSRTRLNNVGSYWASRTLRRSECL